MQILKRYLCPETVMEPSKVKLRSVHFYKAPQAILVQFLPDHTLRNITPS